MKKTKTQEMLEKIENLYEMVKISHGEIGQGMEVRVFPSYHCLTNYPNFHIKTKDFEAEFKIPKTIPERPSGFEFLGYKGNNKKYYKADHLRKIMKWLGEKNKKENKLTNLEAIWFFWKGLNSDWKE